MRKLLSGIFLPAASSVSWLHLLVADMLLIWCAWFFYANNAWYATYLQQQTLLILAGVAVLYSCLSIIRHIHNRDNPDTATAHGYVFIQVIFRFLRRCLRPYRGEQLPLFTTRTEKTLFLFVLVKLFFIPVMIQFTVGNYHDFISEIQRVAHHKGSQTFFTVFNNIVFPIAVTAFYLLDTLLFSFGYLVSSSRLRNRIKSVDPTWSGWLVTLACYPPLNNLTASLAPHHSVTYAYFHSIEATFVMRLVVMLLLFVYVWASVSLGAKCSNLTNRGIVQRGAYRFVRHPAYISKVLVWWITLIPVLIHIPLAAAGMLGWTVIYFLRAVTEERHLLQDPDYVAYCAKVKYRFIPGVY